jgi:hypothetical protein
MFHFWENQTIQDVVENSWIDRINPVSGFEGTKQGILKFVIEGNESLISLQKSQIYLKLKLVGTGKIPHTDTAKPGTPTDTKASTFTTSGLSVANAIAHSIFRSCEVKLGNQIITLGNSDYGYTTVLQILCTTTKESQDTYFSVIGWHKDTPGKMEAPNAYTDANNALLQRRNFFNEEGIGEFIIRPHTAIQNMDKCILPYCSLEISLQRHNNPQFYMKAINDEITSTPFDIEIVQAYYEVQRFKLSRPFNTDMELMLQSHPIVYNLKDSHIHTCTIPQSVSNYSNDSLFHGTVPRRIIIAFVSTANYNGKHTGNPYFFDHFKIESLRLMKNGLEFPVTETVTNFKSTPYTFMQAYHRMMMSLNADYSEHVISITPNEYAQGTFFYSFIMAPDQEGHSEAKQLAAGPAQIKIEVRFSENLDKSIQMIVYSESDTIVSVDTARRVVVTHK